MQPHRLLPIQLHLLRRPLFPNAGRGAHDVRAFLPSFPFPYPNMTSPEKINQTTLKKNIKKTNPPSIPQRSLRPRTQQFPLRRPLRVPGPLQLRLHVGRRGMPLPLHDPILRRWRRLPEQEQYIQQPRARRAELYGPQKEEHEKPGQFYR